MQRLQISYDRVLLEPRDFDPAAFDAVLRRFLETSATTPLVVEVFSAETQLLAFLREGQIYWTGANGGDRFAGITIRDFFTTLRRTQFPRIVVYGTSLLLYHSLLVYLQKSPELKVSSSLVDLEELLDRAEAESAGALLTASRPGTLVMYRYGRGGGSCFVDRVDARLREGNPREDFLVRVYTLSTHRPLEIRLFNDLVVTHAEDARPVPEGYEGSVSSLFLLQPPRLVVRLKNRPLKTYTVTGREISIGRLPENDIVIDNLGVSRRHAVIRSTRSGYVVCDLGSRNGTSLNGEPIERAPVADGDVIRIGKYDILFQRSTGEENPLEELDRTMIVPCFHDRPAERSRGEFSVSFPLDAPAPRLYRRDTHEEHVLGKDRLVIGKSADADIRVGGLLSPRLAAEITRNGGDWVLNRLSSRRKVSVNGEETDNKVLDEEDLISIGADEFVFKR